MNICQATARAIVAGLLSVGSFLADAAPAVRRIYRPERSVRGNENIRLDLAIDKAAWIWKVAPLESTSMTGKGENDAWGVGSESLSCGTGFYGEEPSPGAWTNAVVVRKAVGPKGVIVSDLRFDGKAAKGAVRLPEGLTGVFSYAGCECKLEP